eukprot:m.221473 g.221473  ORF g.221473 m.221473 type:complete len:96 (+) comp19188_c0_seq9:1784-2071(+)
MTLLCGESSSGTSYHNGCGLNALTALSQTHRIVIVFDLYASDAPDPFAFGTVLIIGIDLQSNTCSGRWTVGGSTATAGGRPATALQRPTTNRHGG